MKTRLKDTSIPLYSPQSHANSAIQPGSKLLTSATAAWRSALLEVWQQPSTVEEFTTVSTPDQVIVFTSAGHYEIESYAKGSWRTARYQPGKGGATAPFNTSRLRWRSGDTSSITTLHLYLPHEFLLEAGEEYRRAGSAFAVTPVDFLSIDDPQIYQVLRGLARGVEMSAPDLYCDAACRMLAVHLLLIGGGLKIEDLARNIGSELTDRRLRRVVEYMHHHATDTITLDQLASEACISRFHFTRLFKAKLGLTPHEYLVRLRLGKAAHLLRTTDLDIVTVASECGYPHPGRFAQAFRKLFSESPSAYRRSGGLTGT